GQGLGNLHVTVGLDGGENLVLLGQAAAQLDFLLLGFRRADGGFLVDFGGFRLDLGDLLEHVGFVLCLGRYFNSLLGNSHGLGLGNHGDFRRLVGLNQSASLLLVFLGCDFGNLTQALLRHNEALLVFLLSLGLGLFGLEVAFFLGGELLQSFFVILRLGNGELQNGYLVAGQGRRLDDHGF